jgi:hypothetical protein
VDYRLYLLRGGRIRDAVDIHAADDDAALRQAEKEAGSIAAELWCGDRRVANLIGREAA